MMDTVYLFFHPLTVSSGTEYCFNTRIEKPKTRNYPAGAGPTYYTIFKVFSTYYTIFKVFSKAGKRGTTYYPSS